MIQFWVNSEKPRDAQHGDGVCCALAPQLVDYFVALLVLVTVEGEASYTEEGGRQRCL